MEFPALALEIGVSCQAHPPPSLQQHSDHFANGSLRSAGSPRAVSTLEGNERHKLSTAASPSPLSIPVLQDDSYWEGVRGVRGWKQISLASGNRWRILVPQLALLTRCACVYHIEARKCVFIQLLKTLLCVYTDFGIHLSPELRFVSRRRVFQVHHMPQGSRHHWGADGAILVYIITNQSCL